MPVFILMIFGIFEFSGLIMTKTGESASVKGGARMAVVAGNDATADQAILLRMSKDGSGFSQDKINQVIIWRVDFGSDGKPTKDTATPPQACIDATGFRTSVTAWHCNVYNDPQNPTYGAFAKAALPLSTPPTAPTGGNSDYFFGCDTSTGSGAIDAMHKLDCGWEPQTRKIYETSPDYTSCQPNNPGHDSKCGSTDWVGIYINATHNYYTGFFGKQITLGNQTIASIEPQGYLK